MAELDVRGLPPPEPFENIMRTLQTLPAGETLRVHIHREPYPLYEILRENGYRWQTVVLAEDDFEILITRDSRSNHTA